MMTSLLANQLNQSNPMDQLPSDHFVNAATFTRVNHRDVYSAVDPSSPALSQSQAGKIVVITGASRGIGRRGFAASFAKAGAKALVLIARSASSLAETVEDIKAINSKVETLVIPTDIGNEASVHAAFAKVKEVYGTADVLISNAGTLSPEQKLGDVDIKSWWSDFVSSPTGFVLLIDRGAPNHHELTGNQCPRLGIDHHSFPTTCRSDQTCYNRNHDLRRCIHRPHGLVRLCSDKACQCPDIRLSRSRISQSHSNILAPRHGFDRYDP